MKKFLLLLIVPFIVLSQFRGVDWGSTKEATIAILGEPNKVLENGILYTDFLLGGKKVYTICYFDNNKLYKGAYVLNELHSNKNDYLFDFSDWKKALTEKYGEPIENEVIWKNDLYKGQTQDYGMAISAGHLLLYSIYEEGDTSIECSISGDNYELTVKIIYSSKSLSDLKKKKINTEGF